MLEEFMGIPAHPLLVHAAVVLVPLLAILAVAYAFLPFVRPHTRWVLGLLAVAAPVAALLARQSGEEFFERLEAKERISAGYYPRLEEHGDLGTNTLIATAVLGLLALVLVYFVRPASAGRSAHTAVVARGARLLPVVLGVLSLAAAVASVYYVVRTGDTGAKAVWEGS